jgi:hypothetical protein
MKRRQLVGLFLSVISFACLGTSHEDPGHEQLDFGSEQAIKPVQKPVVVPEGLVEALRLDKIALNVAKPCLREQHLDQIPGPWFVASEVHLDGPDEVDLVVLPRNACLIGANVGPFWLARKTPQGFQIVFSSGGHDLEILRTRSGGFRDIRLESATATTLLTTTFKFNGQSYQPHQKTSRPIDPDRK